MGKQGFGREYKIAVLDTNLLVGLRYSAANSDMRRSRLRFLFEAISGRGECPALTETIVEELLNFDRKGAVEDLKVLRKEVARYWPEWSSPHVLSLYFEHNGSELAIKSHVLSLDTAVKLTRNGTVVKDMQARGSRVKGRIQSNLNATRAGMHDYYINNSITEYSVFEGVISDGVKAVDGILHEAFENEWRAWLCRLPNEVSAKSFAPGQLFHALMTMEVIVKAWPTAAAAAAAAAPKLPSSLACFQASRRDHHVYDTLIATIAAGTYRLYTADAPFCERLLRMSEWGIPTPTVLSVAPKGSSFAETLVTTRGDDRTRARRLESRDS